MQYQRNLYTAEKYWATIPSLIL